MPPAVARGVLEYTSASQIKLFESCPLRWYSQYVLGEKPPQTQSQATGEAVHAQLERSYLSSGREIPEHESARLLTEHADLPAKDPSVYTFLVEHPNDKNLGLTVNGTRLVGRIDLIAVPHDETQPISIIDFKTTSNLKYALTTEQLGTDTQMLMYARWSVEHYPGRAVRLFHAYAGTKKVEAYVPPPACLTPEQVYGRFARIEGLIREMQAAASSQPGGTPGNSTCWSYGKLCAFAPRCPAYAAWRAESKPAKTVSLPSDSFRDSFLASLAPPTTEAPVTDIKITTVPAPTINPPDSTLRKPKGLDVLANENNVFVLLVNVVPFKGVDTFTRLEDLIAEHAAPICAASKVSDVRQIPYGAGKTALVDAFRKNPPKGVVVATAGGLASEVIEVLSPMAALVIKGTV